MSGIIPDTLSGALILSIFDFVTCFIVLWVFGLFIKGLKKIN